MRTSSLLQSSWISLECDVKNDQTTMRIEINQNLSITLKYCHTPTFAGDTFLKKNAVNVESANVRGLLNGKKGDRFSAS